MGSYVMLQVLFTHCLWQMSDMGGSELPIILSAVFTRHCRALRSESLQFPNHVVRMLTIVSLQNVVRMGGGMFALLSQHTERCCCAFLASEVVRDVQTQKSLYPDCLYRRPIDVLWEVVIAVSVCFVNIQRQIAVCTAVYQMLHSDSSLSLMRPTAAMSSLNLMMRFVLCLAVQS